MTAALPSRHDRCPLCGEPNECVPAASGSFAQPCWCERASFGEALAAGLPAEARGSVCICPVCVRTQPGKAAAAAAAATRDSTCR